MNNNQNLDFILPEISIERQDDLKLYGPDFRRIERGVLNNYKNRNRKHKRAVFIRVASAVLAAFILINGFLIFAEIEPVQAYRSEIRKLFFNLFNDNASTKTEAEIIRSSNEISKIKNLVPFSIPVPSWLPPGYLFENANASNDGNNIYNVVLKYINGSDELIMQISNETELSATFPSLGEGNNYKKEVVNGYDVYISSPGRDNGDRVKCMYYDKQGLYIYISCSIDKQSLLKFLENFK